MTHFKKPYTLRRLSGSITEPLSLSLTKQHLRVEHSEDDAFISELLIAARQIGEYSAGCAFASAPFEACYEQTLALPLCLPITPVASITSITTQDVEGNSSIIPTTDYHLQGDSLLYMDYALCAAHIAVRLFTSGELGAQPHVKRALLAHIALMYEQRSGDTPVPQESLMIYHQFREVRV